MPQPASLELEFRRVTWEGIRPVSAGVAIVFACFIVFNWIDLPARAAGAVIAHDVVMVVLCSSLWWAFRAGRVPVRWTYQVAATLALAIVSNVLLAEALVGDPFYTFYIGIIIIAVGSFVLSTRWLLAIVVIIGIAWGAITLPLTDGHMFVHFGFTLVASVMVSVTAHLARRRSHRRIVQLRQVDEQTKIELERALDEAETARFSLDSKVEERTAEVVKVHEEIKAELAERKRVERDRLELRSRLERAQRVESVGRLAGGVAHDFNNLLSVMQGSIQLAQMHPETPPAVTEALGDALRAVKRAADLTEQLLTYGRKQTMAPTVLSAESVLIGICSMLEQLAGKSIAVEIVVSPDAGNIYADRAQLEQLIVNLTTNACDAMPKGGKLTIEATRRSVTDELCQRHAGATPGDYLCLSVADQGHGMSEEMAAKIFEPFFTTKEAGRGTGLGLAVVDGVVSQHGGFIEISTKPGVGSSFEVYLPEIGPEAGPPSQETFQLAPQTDNRGYETVAIVEPDSVLRRTACRVLRALGYEVLEAADGGRMTSIAEGHLSEIHLLLVGAQLPHRERNAIVDRLRQERPRLRVVVAGGPSEGDGPAGGLPERYEADALASAVREALDQGAPDTLH